MVDEQVLSNEKENKQQKSRVVETLPLCFFVAYFLYYAVITVPVFPR